MSPAALVVSVASFEDVVAAAAAATAANRFMRRVRLAADREGRAGVSRGGLLHAGERSVTTVASLNRRPLYAESSVHCKG